MPLQEFSVELPCGSSAVAALRWNRDRLRRLQNKIFSDGRHA